MDTTAVTAVINAYHYFGYQSSKILVAVASSSSYDGEYGSDHGEYRCQYLYKQE